LAFVVMTRHFDGSSVYSKQQRPVRCLPERLIGDRRPLESTRADQLASSLNMESVRFRER
jgi:hypothetical protein